MPEQDPKDAANETTWAEWEAQILAPNPNDSQATPVVDEKEADEDILFDNDEIVDGIRCDLDSGLRSKEEISGYVQDAVLDTDDPETVERVLLGELDRLWAERLVTQASWPAEVSGDRLRRAFAQMEANGLVARMDFTCCNTCGHYEIGDEVEPGTNPVGYVFFHAQGTDRLVEYGDLYLAHGPFGDDPALEVEVPRRAKEALEAEGFTVDWDGTAQRALKIGPIYWQCRLPE